MKAVAAKVERSIGVDPVTLIQRAIFGNLLEKVFNVLSGFIHKPRFFQGLDNRVNGRRVDLLLPLGNGSEDLGTGGIAPEVFFYSPPELKRDGREHSLSAPIDIVTFKVAYRKTIYFSVPNPRSCKGLDPLGYSPIFGCYPVI